MGKERERRKAEASGENVADWEIMSKEKNYLRT